MLTVTRREEGGVGTKDEMVGSHYGLNGLDFEQTQGDSEGQKPGVLQSTGLQRVGQDLANEQQQ